MKFYCKLLFLCRFYMMMLNWKCHKLHNYETRTVVLKSMLLGAIEESGKSWTQEHEMK